MRSSHSLGNGPRRPRVLVLAFACDPYEGSESGVGWGVVQACAEIADLVILVPPKYMRTLEAWQQKHNDERLRFVEVSVPRSVEILFRLMPWSQKLMFVMYVFWLRSAKHAALRLEMEAPFDGSVHAAYGSYWLPSPIVHLRAPSVWGPVGGATATPRRLWRFLGWRGLLGEGLKWVTIRVGSLLPATRRTWRRASIRIVETENSRRALPRSMQAETRVINRAILQGVLAVNPGERQNYLLFPSALQARKGVRLALHALARTPSHVRLIFVADGYEQGAFKNLAKRLGIADRTEFRGRIPRAEMFRMMVDAAAVVFTGLREEGGCALSEAMQLGAPVIVLGHGGARIVAEANTDPSRVALIEPQSSKRTVADFAAAMTRFSSHPLPARGSYLDCAGTKRALQQALRDAIAKSAGPPEKRP
jgi:glycosyltransferase involved in cell wall biosynthesis